MNRQSPNNFSNWAGKQTGKQTGNQILQRALIASLLLALSSGAFALKTDRSQPMDLRADKWVGLQSGTQSWSGNVRIVQGSLQINADSGTLQYAGGAMKSAEFAGTPVRIAQTRDGGGAVTAQARNVEYDLVANTVILTGAVRIEEDGNTTTGERFVYALDTGAINGDGGTGQVQMRLIPKAEPAPK